MPLQSEYTYLNQALKSVRGLGIREEIAVRETLDRRGLPAALGQLGVFKARTKDIAAPDPAEGSPDDVEFPTAFDDAALAALDRFAGDWDALTAAVSQLQPMGVGFQPHGRKLTDSGRSTLKSKAAQPDLAVDAIKRGFSGWDRR